VRVSEEYAMLSVHISGEWDIVVYPKPEHTPARFTILNFPVEDIDNKAVYELTSSGESALRALRRLRDAREGHLHGGRGPLNAWFKDPPLATSSCQ